MGFCERCGRFYAGGRRECPVHRRPLLGAPAGAPLAPERRAPTGEGPALSPPRLGDCAAPTPDPARAHDLEAAGAPASTVAARAETPAEPAALPDPLASTAPESAPPGDAAPPAEATTVPEAGPPVRRLPGDLPVGAVVDRRYQVLSVIGRGGMAAVYRALQLGTGRQVALKVLHCQTATLQPQRFAIEARATSALRSPHTITVYDFGEAPDGTLYLAMELLEGEPLDALLADHGVLPWRRAAELVAQVCSSLAEAHEQGIVHRDLKPSNVFVCRSRTGGDSARVLDFGIAKLRGGAGVTNLTGTGMVLGTPRYMAPEQAMGEPVDGRTDLYALGVLLYELLTGRPPFDASLPISLMMQHCHDPVPPPERLHPELAHQLPPSLRSLLFELLAKEPEERPPSASLVRDHLLATLAQPSRVPEPTPEPPSLSRARRLLWFLLTLPLAWGVAALAEAWRAPAGVAALLGGGPAIGHGLVASLGGGLWALSWWLSWSWARRRRPIWPEVTLAVGAAGAVAGLALGARWSLAPLLEGLSLPWRSGLEISPGRVDELAGRLGQLVAAEQAAASLALLAAAAVAALVLLGWLLLAPAASSPRGSWRAPLGAVVALSLPLLAELWLAPAALAAIGPWRWGVYTALALPSVALGLWPRSQRPGAEASPWPWLAVGLLLAATTALAATRALAEGWQALPTLPLESITVVWRQRQETIAQGVGVLAALACVAAGAALLLSAGVRRALAWPAPGAGLAVGVALLLLVLGGRSVLADAEAAGALLGTLYAMPGLAEMHPVAPAQGAADRPLYLDRRPCDLRVGREALLARLSPGARGPYRSERLLAALTGSRRCPGLLRRLAEDPPPSAPDDYEPTRCLTPAEAEQYCHARGKRLPTPAEWTAALGALTPLRTRQLANSVGLVVGRRPEWARTAGAARGEGYVSIGAPASGASDAIPTSATELQPGVTFRCAH